MQGGVVTFIGLVEPSLTGIKMRYQGINVLICTKSSDQGMFCSKDQAVIFFKKAISYKKIFLIKYQPSSGVQSSDQGKFS